MIDLFFSLKLKTTKTSIKEKTIKSLANCLAIYLPVISHVGYVSHFIASLFHVTHLAFYKVKDPSTRNQSQSWQCEISEM